MAVIGVLIFGFLIFAVVNQWEELQRRDIRFDPIWLLPASLLLLTSMVYTALGWDLVVRFLGYPLRPARAQMIWGQSLLARYVPGNVLYVVGRVMLVEREGVPRRIGLASMVYELVLQLSAAVIVASYFFITHPDLAGEPVRWAVLAVVPLALLSLSPPVFAPLSRRVLARFGREPLPVVLPMRGVAVMLAYYTAAWVLVGLGIFFVARSVVDLPLAELPVVGSAQAFAFCAAVLSVVVPSGIGVRDGAFAWAVKIAVDGSFAVGAAIAIAVRVMLTLVELVYVGAVSLVGHRAGVTDAAALEGDAVDELEGGQREDAAEQHPVAGQGG